MSQLLGSRRKALAIFLGITALGIGFYFAVAARSLMWFYAGCVGLGLGTGYWAVFVTSAADQTYENALDTHQANYEYAVAQATAANVQDVTAAQALYRAKKGGRNRIEIAAPPKQAKPVRSKKAVRR